MFTAIRNYAILALIFTPLAAFSADGFEGGFDGEDSFAQSDQSGFGPTVQNDTLWAIAEKMRTDNIYTVEEMMLAIFLENREAFVKDNPDKLKANQYLKNPTTDRLSAVSQLNVKQEMQKYSGRNTTAKTRSKPKALNSAEEQERLIEAQNEALRKQVNELEKEVQTMQAKREKLEQKLDE